PRAIDGQGGGTVDAGDCVVRSRRRLRSATLLFAGCERECPPNRRCGVDDGGWVRFASVGGIKNRLSKSLPSADPLAFAKQKRQRLNSLGGTAGICRRPGVVDRR